MRHGAHERVVALFNRIHPISAELSETIRQHSMAFVLDAAFFLLSIITLYGLASRLKDYES